MLRIWTVEQVEFKVKDGNKIYTASGDPIAISTIVTLDEAILTLLHYFIYEYKIVYDAELYDIDGKLHKLIVNGRSLISLKRKRRRLK